MIDMDRAAVEAWQRRECAADVSDVSDVSDAASLLTQMLTNAVEGRPSIEEIGLRAWIMCSRVAPGCLGMVSAPMRREMQRVAGVCNWHLRVPRDSSQVVMVVERVLGAETRTPERTGRRVSLLAYALCRAAVVNALPSLEEIGRLWRLRARNKRSLPSLEMKRLLREHWLAGRPMWFQKSAVAVESYAAAQAGNDNRAGDCPERRALAHYTAEVRDGIPVRPEFRTLSPRALAKRLSQMAEDADRRRLGI